MKKRKSVLVRILSVFLVVIMVSGAFIALASTVKAATTNKVERSYEIAVVFDNSGSMYDNQGWCRAKYAMEIFASMLDYDDGDKLKIFPMWEVATDGTQPDSGGSYAAIEINSKNDIDKISNLYTVHPSSTPFAPITEAYEYLQTSKATEKWLVVLTDGAFNQEARGIKAAVDLQGRLSVLASEKIKVQYLGFGEATQLSSDEARGFYAKKSTDTSLKDDLITICNTIFQRSVLPESRLNGQKLEIDLSMKNLIVFAQGSNAKIDSLVNEKGKDIKVSLDSGQRKYSEIKAKGYESAPIDTSLAGQVVTFAACPAGTYTLNYSGTDAIQIFYEPDVDIAVTLINSDGEILDAISGEIVAGEYTVNSKIIDRKTEQDVTKHELMGNDVKLTTKVKSSSDSEYIEYPNNSKITFEPDSSTEVVVEGTYLKDYKISTKDSPDLMWLSAMNIKAPSVEFKVDAKVLQEQSWYKLKNHEKWKPIKVLMTIDGQPLTDEQLEQIKLNIETSDKLLYQYEIVSGESAYDIYICQDENGKYKEPETGKYKMEIWAKYVDSYGNETSDGDTVSFEIQSYDKMWRWLAWLLLAFIIFLLILWWNFHKAFPQKITLHKQSTKNKTFVQQGEKQKIGKSFSLRDGASIIFSGTAQKVTPHYKRKSTGAMIKVDVKNIGAKVKNLKIGATRITPDERIVTISDTDVVTFNNAAGAEKKYQIRINN